MSEQQPRHHEKEHQLSLEASAERHEKLKRTQEAGERARHEHQETIETIRHQAREEAISGREHSAGDNSKETRSHSSLIIDKTVRSQAYQKTLAQIRHHLSKRERSFSKFIHSPRVEAISEFSAKTVARPSGLLGGGIFALIGTSVVVYMSRQAGFRYNFFTFIALLLIGFGVGLFFELLFKGGRKLFGR